jgi:hypothetical protein
VYFTEVATPMLLYGYESWVTKHEKSEYRRLKRNLCGRYWAVLSWKNSEMKISEEIYKYSP